VKSGATPAPSHRRSWFVAALGILAVAVVASAPLVGPYAIDLGAIFEPEADSVAARIFWQIRVPRVLVAFLAGCGLAAGGMTFQAMFRNPLATPFTLGVASGASLGAALTVRLGLDFAFAGFAGTSVGAFAGALLSIGLVYGIARLRRGFSTTTLLLAGVALSFFFSSLILFVQYTSDLYSSFRIVRWLMGGLADTLGFQAVARVLPWVVAGLALLAFLPRELNVLTTGEDLAASRGVDVIRTKRLAFVATSLMVGGIVAVCGPIGFVGMMVPHMCRLLVGPDHRLLMPATIFAGGAFLTACDTAARLMLLGAELPVGVITAFLGGPFFLWLLLWRSPERSLG